MTLKIRFVRDDHRIKSYNINKKMNLKASWIQ